MKSSKHYNYFLSCKNWMIWWCRNYSLVLLQMNEGLQQMMERRAGGEVGRGEESGGCGCRVEWLRGTKSSSAYLCLSRGSPLSLFSPFPSFPNFLPLLPPHTPLPSCSTLFHSLSICLSVTSLPPSWPLLLALHPLSSSSLFYSWYCKRPSILMCSAVLNAKTGFLCSSMGRVSCHSVIFRSLHWQILSVRLITSFFNVSVFLTCSWTDKFNTSTVF